MKKIKFTFFDMHPFILFCVMYTTTLVIASVLTVIFTDEQYVYTLNLFAYGLLCAAPVVTLMLFTHVPFLRFLNDDDCSPWVSIPVHYVISCVLVILTFLALDAVRSLDAQVSEYVSLIGVYTQGYIVVVLVAAVIEIFQTETVNGNLKKIRKSKGDV